MASTQKKTTTSKTGASRSSASKSGTSRSGASRSRSAPASKAKSRPVYREVGGAVCLLLAFFTLLNLFGVKALFLDLLGGLFRGLLGWGFWALPFMLMVGAYILFTHRGRPVRLRLTGALLFPVFLGGILHLLLCGKDFPWDAKLLAALWQSGGESASGGVVSGLLAMALRAAVSGVGALVLLIILAAAALLCAFHVTVADVSLALQKRRESRRTYAPDDYEAPPEPSRPARREPERKAAGEPRRRPAIDIPVDDPPVTAKAPTTPVTTVRKKKLFDRFAGVPSPDKVAGGDLSPQREEAPPEYEDVPELSAIPEQPPVRPGREAPEQPAVLPMPEPRPAPEPAPSPRPGPESALQPETDPLPPPIIREPAVEPRGKETKAYKREMAQQALDEVTREIAQSLAEEPPAYRYPPLSLLREGGGAAAGEALSELHANRQRLEATLQSFGVDAHITDVTRGPSVTRYELELEQGVKLNKITNLSDDIALSLGAAAVRVAPIPDKISTVGIEVPNRSVTSVSIREVIGSSAFAGSPSKVSFAVGKDIAGNCIVGNIAKLPHMLIAGTTGSGKSVCTNSLIISLLYKATPEEVRLIMVDPKMVELGVYNGIPHLLIPVVTDPKKAAGALQWAVSEMMKRYQAFSEVGAKDLASYNNHMRREGGVPLPQIVVVIDELADLMLVAAKEVEESICRVAQMGRASGMHLVIATQRPSADVITGLMKANIPSRIAFAVASSLESRIILDNTGAEMLVGKGDMLYAPLGQGKPMRVQGCFISEEEVAAVVDFIKESSTAQYDESVIHEIERHAEEKEKSAHGVGGGDPTAEDDGYDELLPAAIEVVLDVGQASVSMLQRRLKLGYGRAARLVDQMEEKGVVGPFEGSKPRQLLITKEQWQEMQFKQGMVDRASDTEYAADVPEEASPAAGEAPDAGAPPFDGDE